MASWAGPSSQSSCQSPASACSEALREAGAEAASSSLSTTVDLLTSLSQSSRGVLGVWGLLRGDTSTPELQQAPPQLAHPGGYKSPRGLRGAVRLLLSASPSLHWQMLGCVGRVRQ